MRATAFDRAAYRAGVAARVAWFGAHYAALARMTGRTGRSSPQMRKALSGAMSDLFQKDWANVAAGVYPAPEDAPRLADAPRIAGLTRRFFKDARAVDGRRKAHNHSEVLSEELRASYPRYYLQNFHYQTDGWLSEDSARLYDMQVEVLFTGAADAMRRQALPFIAEALSGRDPRLARHADFACGTGRFLQDVKRAFPLLPVTAIDLSPDYLRFAENRLRGTRDVSFVQANAEATPLADDSQDIVTAIYLFHELPPKARAAVAAEIARVLKPGGVFVLVDTLQLGDNPPLDGLLERFPEEFHEPYYSGYIAEDLGERFGAAGLVRMQDSLAFLSKATAFRKA
ncbi:MAG: class I SAM-dependent methyltransferase [Pseudomonadota bacterium]